jgi:hypothetical protein
MDEVWPEAQAMSRPTWQAATRPAIVFASNTHDFLIRLVAALPAPQRAGRCEC